MKILSILLLIIVFVGSFLLGFQVRAKELGIKLYNIGNISSLPILTGGSVFPILSGQGVIAVDSSSNVTLYEKNADTQLYPASTTKIITALVSLDYYRSQQELVVLNPVVDGQKMGLMTGEKMTFLDLLSGLLIYSANDAAVTLADNYAGGREAFVNAMNVKVQQLHLDHSHFANPAGLDDPLQFTTARDMVRVAQVAMENPTFAKIVGTKQKLITDTTGKFSYSLNNVNQLLGSVPGVIGIKTGYTDAARENLITEVARNNHSVFIAILGSEDRFGETTELINWVYGNYEWQKVTFTQKAVGMLLR
jgi:serine-type D-Ala-D-Ala carboxypeptidase (penicillin-binding protein 5/6)